MADADSQRWTWTFGLLTAASACLLPVPSEACVGECCDESDTPDVEQPSADLSDPVDTFQRDVEIAALPVKEDDERESGGPSPIHPSNKSTRRVLSTTHPIASTGSQLLAAPGPPIHLIAPSHSPPSGHLLRQ